MSLDLLALSICIIWAMTVGFFDLTRYRISNTSLTLGLVLIWPSLYLNDQRFQITLAVLALAVVAFAAGLASLVGMGDVKLLLFFAPWLDYENLSNALILLIVISWLQLLTISLIQRHFPKQIAFAPAILLAVALNMAT